MEDYNKYDLMDDSKDADLREKNQVTENPIDTLIAITKTPLELVQRILTAKETSKHAKGKN